MSINGVKADEIVMMRAPRILLGDRTPSLVLLMANDGRSVAMQSRPAVQRLPSQYLRKR